MYAKMRGFDFFLCVICGLVCFALFFVSSWFLSFLPVVGLLLICVLICFVGFCTYFSIKSFLAMRKMAKVLKSK